ncbi:MAG: tyrosine-type recombinase/integrase [Desulfobaccales bacterium]
MAKGTFLPIKEVPKFSEVATEWLEYKRAKIRETTWEVYEEHIRNHFDDLKGFLINRITIAVVESFITKRQAQGMNIGTLRKILITLGQILSYAVKHRYLDFNPLREAERPREQANGREEEDKVATLTPAQITTLLEQVADPKYQTLFLMAIMTGARQGELLGIKWDDINWRNKQVHIQRTFNKGRFFIPKTKGSKRHIDLAPVAVQELKRWRLACPTNDLDLVFPNETGGPMNYSNMVQRYFLPALKASDLPRVRFHDLRHTNASLRLENGENIKYIQTQLGHANPTVTLNVYAHLMTATNQEAACRLENAVFGAVGHHLGTKN